MKPAAIFSFVVLSFSIVFGQNNPYSKYGYEPLIATMSNGQFDEFHDRDTIVQIGRVVYNTKSKTVLGFIAYDTLYSEADLSPDIVSRWLSPDPMQHMRLWLSPYNFVQNNPINRIDPDGRLDHEYSVDKKGNTKLEKRTTDDFDMVYAKADYDKGDLSNGHRVNDQSILPQLSENRKDAVQKDWITQDKLQGHYALSSNKTETLNLFTFLADNSKVEWTLHGNKSNQWALATLHENSQAFSTYGIEGFSRLNTKIHFHSHPDGTAKDFNYSGNDLNSAQRTQAVNPTAKYYIYAPKLNMENWNSVFPENQINYEPSKFIKVGQ